MAKTNKEFNASKRVLDLTTFTTKTDQERYDEILRILKDIYVDKYEVTPDEVAKCIGLVNNGVNTSITLPKRLKVTREDTLVSFAFNDNKIAGLKPLTIALLLFGLTLFGSLYAGYVYLTSDRDCSKELNKDIYNDGVRILNISLSDKCKPEINIDPDDAGIPQVNIDYRGNRMKIFNIDIDGNGVATYNLINQYTGWRQKKYGAGEYCDLKLPNGEKCDLNCDITGDGWPDLNIDLTGDGFPDVNIDTDCDEIADINIDIDGDGKCDLRCDTDGDGKCDFRCTEPWPQMNVDLDGDGNCDVNCDIDGDGKCDYNCAPVIPGYPGNSGCKINCDTNGDGKCDYSCDTNGDGKCDWNCYYPGKKPGDGEKYCYLNCDFDDDGKCDLNCDTNGDGKCNYNCDPGSTGKCTWNCYKPGKKPGDGEKYCYRNCDFDDDGECDLNCDPDNTGKCKYNCDPGGTGKCTWNCYNPGKKPPKDGPGQCYRNCDFDDDGECDLNCDPDNTGKCKYNCDPGGTGKCTWNCYNPGKKPPKDGPDQCYRNCDTDDDGKCDSKCDSVITTTTKKASKTLTVTFNASGGSGGTTSRSCTTTGSSCSINLNNVTAPTKSGYNFNGWSETTACGTKKTGNYSISSNKTLYACWTAKTTKTTTTTQPAPTIALIEYVGGPKINVSGLLPDDQPGGSGITVPTKEFRIINHSDYAIVYTIRWVVTQNTYTSNNLEYRITGTMGGFNSGYNTLSPPPWVVLPKISATATQRVIAQNITIAARSTHYYSIEIHLKGTGTVQNEDQGKVFGGYLEVLV